MLDAIAEAKSNQMKCRFLLLRGTEYGTTKAGFKSAVDPESWRVKKLSGDVEAKFQFELERVRDKLEKFELQLNRVRSSPSMEAPDDF